MTEQEARKLKPGDRVTWHGSQIRSRHLKSIPGVVVEIGGQTPEAEIEIRIKWDDGLIGTSYVTDMPNIEREKT